MERYTFESDGYPAVRGEDCFDDQDENYCGPAIDRLAAYEDTGLTPDDVVDLMGNHGMALSELAKVPQWIPVTERKPTAADADAKGNVLAYSKEGTANTHGWWLVSTSPTIFTHWQPLPQAPGKEGA